MTATDLPRSYTELLAALKVRGTLTLDELFADFERREGSAWAERFDAHLAAQDARGAYQLLFETPEAAQVSHAMVHHVSAEWLEQVIALTPPGGALLDVGCGAGVHALYFAQRRPDARVFGLDIASNGVARARERAEALGLVNVEFFEGDARAAPPPALLSAAGEGFDVVLSHCLLHELGLPNLLDWHERLSQLSWEGELYVRELIEDAHDEARAQRGRYARVAAQHLAALAALSRRHVCAVERLPTVIESAMYATAARLQGLEVQWGQTRRVTLRNHAIQREERMPLWVMEKGASVSAARDARLLEAVFLLHNDEEHG